MQSEFLSLEETSAYLNLKISNLRFLIFKQKIPYVKLGRSIRFEKKSLEKWIKDNSFGLSDQ
ncbi:MAG: helix-turn-helix domain-containing protein [Pseudobdellovibrionaceae bacterium]